MPTYGEAFADWCRARGHSHEAEQEARRVLDEVIASQAPAEPTAPPENEETHPEIPAEAPPPEEASPEEHDLGDHL